ncbi:MAG TPA: UDP-glucose--hexose-1-phosphate uridylyltransferase [Vicinamibacterales bacterium]|nr:UDP-glucose--hexose-1-phosphate uridylyltransferase [Vicinamibacterales bacterium]
MSKESWTTVLADNPGPHRRFNPLRAEWVVVSPHRNRRPWQGEVERPPAKHAQTYDPDCYLCPRNVRADGATNPDYATTFVFENDYPALWPGISINPDQAFLASGSELLMARPARGLCRVVCFSPRHDVTLPQMDVASIRDVVDVWVAECDAIALSDWAQYVLVFENRGSMMGASNPHPHGQIWATDHVPNEPAREQTSLEQYAREHDSCLLCDYVALEIDRQERVVCANDAFIVVVPFWATWPFETLLVSRRHVATLSALRSSERDALADVLKRLTTRYDNVFETPFPYSMGFHQQPIGGAASSSHLHAHFYPPLVRSASVRKFMVGFELLGSPQRDFTPEQAAEQLQQAAEILYTSRGDVVVPR